MSVAYLPERDQLAEGQHALADAAAGLIGTAIRSSLSGLGPTDLLAFAGDLEKIRNSLAVLDHAIIGALEDTRAAEVLTCRNTVTLLTETLRITRADAYQRVEAAKSLGERITLGGQPMPPARAYLAERQAAGRVTPAQARVIHKMLHRLTPHPGIDPADLDEAETILVNHTDTLGVRDLEGLAAEITDRLDPDGNEPRDDERLRQRFLRVHDSGKVTGQVTAELLATLRAVLDPLAAPRPADVSGRDARTAGQRMHDALLDALHHVQDTGNTSDALHRLQDTGAISDTSAAGSGSDAGSAASLGAAADWSAGGTTDSGTATTGSGTATPGSSTATPGSSTATTGSSPVTAGPSRTGARARGTVITTIRLEDLISGCGYATSTHGVPIPIRDLLREAAQLRFLPAVLDSRGVVLYLGRAQRLATASQYIALVARDGGCSFPGCDVPPEWCDIHHVTSWRDLGPTDIDDLTLACGYHHREFEDRGWESVMVDGLPHWRPPAWIEPTRTPVLHHRITLANRRE
ncbi:uncharacterized protein DUF222 [Antricoccus suffuscus]|uniref:Uncharacterized protein DUF222 n=1 Tax=Antricoccus suffuscus TaxID=1629062 RepID=A0A2T1A6A5_9ACTN|nr:HNH endonuclease signature motif containing protein [Antricoccus suffuscus]PRZ44143.1 uncharacterized protein DUF222 [Antricoccus suffuscus]